MAGTCTAAHPRIRPLLHRHRHAGSCTPPPAPTYPLAHTPAVDWYRGPSRTNGFVKHVTPRQHQRTCSRRTRPQPPDTPGHRARATLLHTPRHTRHSRCPRSSPRHRTHMAPFPYVWPHKPPPPPAVASQHARCAFFLFRAPTLFLAGQFSFLLAAHCAASAYQHARARSTLRHAGIAPRFITPRLRAHARTHARARTEHGRRPTANDATCGPPAWLTGRRHEGGLRSARSPLRRAPLLAAPIATPLQGGRPERPGLLFLKLLATSKKPPSMVGGGAGGRRDTPRQVFLSFERGHLCERNAESSSVSGI